MYKNREPWKVLEAYKGEYFLGEWPTLPELFNITVDRFPERPCFSVYGPDLFFTYKEALSKILSVAGYLKRNGVLKGDKIALTGKNSPEWAITYLSILYAGGVVVPIDYQLHSDEIIKLIEFSGAKLLFVDEEKNDEIALLKKKLKLVSLSPNKENYILDLGDFSEKPGEMPLENDLAAILYTSGTTGHPKGVMLTHQNFVSDCFLAQGHMLLSENDVFYALLPLHHSYSMLSVLIVGLSVGTEIVFARKLVISQILKDLKTGRVTMFLAVPMLFNKMLKALMNGIKDKGILIYGIIRFFMFISGVIKKTTGINPGKRMFKGLLSKLSLDTNRICICGGGPLPSSTFKMFNQLGIDFVQGYGLTETSPIIALNPIEHYKLESVGAVTPRTKMKILDPDETGAGEILVKGPMVMQGYYNNKEATDEIFTKDGWLKTGDVGYLDDENFLYLTGRKKSLIVTDGGKNVFPEEVEDHFQLFDEIEQVLVRGYTLDEKMKTEAIEALIHPNKEAQKIIFEKKKLDYTEENIKIEFDKIIDQVNKELFPYQRISRLSLLDEAMEMTTTKKIKRFKVLAD